MMVTIVGRENGIGLEKDKELLTALLQDNKIITDFRSIDEYKPLAINNDICIHTEVVDKRYYGKINILIPNQEWFMTEWLPEISKFDAIFCKSLYAERIFKKYHKNVIYTGFSSLDTYRREVPKQKIFFHTQGKSNVKGTGYVIEAWSKMDFPKLHLITKDFQMKLNYNNSIELYNSFLSKQLYNHIRNKCLIHILPSLVEGFSHSINESKSCGAVIISTNYPPMNELLNDFLIPILDKKIIVGTLGEIVSISTKELINTVLCILKRDDLYELGLTNRQSFLENDRVFREKFMYALNFYI
ncbi:MAG: glycosyltransferase [Cyclobacteriaceae bacterium]